MTAISSNCSTIDCLRGPEDGHSIAMLPVAGDSSVDRPSASLSPESDASPKPVTGDVGEFIVID